MATRNDPSEDVSTENSALVRSIDAIARRRADSSSSDETWWLDALGYRCFGNWFREQDDRFDTYRQITNQARLARTYDQYLATAALSALLLGVLGGIVGVVTGIFLSESGAFISISYPVSVDFMTPQRANILGTIAVTFGSGILVGGGAWTILYYHPYSAAYHRSRQISQLLPQTVTYIYAHSQGGMRLPDIVDRLAEEEDTYGEVAVEFQAIRNNMRFFGTNMTEALQEARRTTPNDDFGSLLDDFVSYINTGGDLAMFLEEKTREFQRKSRRQEERIIESLELVAMGYLVVGVIFPLAALIIFVVMAALGSAPTQLLYAIIYFGFPVLGILFVIIHDTLTPDISDTAKTLSTSTNPPTPDAIDSRLDDTPESLSQFSPSGGRSHRTTANARPVYSRTDGHNRGLSSVEETGLKDLRQSLVRDRVRSFIRLPINKIRSQPALSAFITTPLAMMSLLVLHLSGIMPITVENFVNTPVWTTTLTVVIPGIVILTPISILHEWQHSAQRQVERELPDTLRKLATINVSGANLIENIELVANSSTGILADELAQTRNHLRWNVSLNDALKQFANRIENARVTRVTKLLIEANTTTGRVTDVLSVAASAAQDQKELDREKFSLMRSKMMIILMGYLMFLGMSAIIVIWLLPSYANAVATTAGGSSNLNGRGVGGITNLSFNLSLYRMVFFHGVLMQAVVGGAVAGKFGYGSIKSGLKFVIGGAIIGTAVFFVI